MDGEIFIRDLVIVLVASLILLAVMWIIFYYLPNHKYKNAQLPEHAENEKQVSLFGQIFRQAKYIFSFLANKAHALVQILRGLRFSFSIFDDASPRIKIGMILIPLAIGLISLLGTSIYYLCTPQVALIWFIAFLVFPTGLTETTFFKSLPSNLTAVLGSFLIAGWFLYFSLLAAIIRIRRRVWFIFYLLFIFLLINNIVGCKPLLERW